MNIMASLITANSTFVQQLAKFSIKEHIKIPQYWALCEGNPPVTSGFLWKRTWGVESVSISTFDILFQTQMAVKLTNHKSRREDRVTIGSDHGQVLNLYQFIYKPMINYHWN